jgi:hypothetical protein
MSVTTPKTHPWNQDFVWTDHEPNGEGLSSDQIEQFDVDGFTVVPGLLDAR